MTRQYKKRADRPKPDYVVYDKEDFPVCIGSAAACARYLGVTEQTVIWMSWKKGNRKIPKKPRFQVFRIDEREEFY